MMAGKLHELLAVESDKEGLFKKIIEETKTVFSKKAQELFTGSERRYEPFANEEKGAKAEGFEQRHHITTTVPDRLKWTVGPIIAYLDAVFQKERTNQNATAKLEIGGKILGEDLPATFLLSLEKKLLLFRPVLELIPTLVPGLEWVEDSTVGKDIFKLKHPEKKFRTKKDYRSNILVKPTEHHPAQIEKWEEQVEIGLLITEKWSGMVTSARKAELLNRLDVLIQEVKKSRMKANCEVVVKSQIGKSICDYLFK
jgi:hypothetical protein